MMSRQWRGKILIWQWIKRIKQWCCFVENKKPPQRHEWRCTHSIRTHTSVECIRKARWALKPVAGSRWDSRDDGKVFSTVLVYECWILYFILCQSIRPSRAKPSRAAPSRAEPSKVSPIELVRSVLCTSTVNLSDIHILHFHDTVVTGATAYAVACRHTIQKWLNVYAYTYYNGWVNLSTTSPSITCIILKIENFVIVWWNKWTANQ